VRSGLRLTGLFYVSVHMNLCNSIGLELPLGFTTGLLWPCRESNLDAAVSWRDIVDGDKLSEEIMATQGLKQGCPLSPLLYALFTNDLGKFFNTSDHGAMTALQTAKVSHCEYAEDIALTTNTAHHLQLQLDRFYTYTALKGLTLNVHKIKTMAFFGSNPPIFCYSGT